MKQLIVKLDVASNLGALCTWMPLELVELGNLNSEIWYALSVAMLPTQGLHAALLCNCVIFNLIFATCDRPRQETSACSLFLHVSRSTTWMVVQAVRIGSACGDTGMTASLLIARNSHASRAGFSQS